MWIQNLRQYHLLITVICFRTHENVYMSDPGYHWFLSRWNMITSSNGNIFRITDPLCGKFTGHRWIPHANASDAELWFFWYLRLNKRLSKQSRGWWFATPSRPLWRHCNDRGVIIWRMFRHCLHFITVGVANGGYVIKMTASSVTSWRHKHVILLTPFWATIFEY